MEVTNDLVKQKVEYLLSLDKKELSDELLKLVRILGYYADSTNWSRKETINGKYYLMFDDIEIYDISDGFELGNAFFK